MTPQEKWRATTDDRIGKNKEALIEQLRKTPIIQIACEKAGIGRSTYYRWTRDDPSFAEATRDALDAGAGLVNDMAESQLLAAIRDGNMTAIIFWLKHHHAAYATRVEVRAKVEAMSQELTPEQEAVVRRALELAALTPSSPTHHDAYPYDDASTQQLPPPAKPGTGTPSAAGTDGAAGSP